MNYIITTALDNDLTPNRPKPEPLLAPCPSTPDEQMSVKFESQYTFVIHENALPNDVCNMSTILFSSWCANSYTIHSDLWIDQNDIFNRKAVVTFLLRRTLVSMSSFD